jgi:hypothetical protein
MPKRTFYHVNLSSLSLPTCCQVAFHYNHHLLHLHVIIYHGTHRSGLNIRYVVRGPGKTPYTHLRVSSLTYPQSSCYSNVTGHAHPTSNDVRDIETVDLQDLSNLIYKVPLDIVLSGLANEHSSPALAPIIPSVRRSPLTSGAVQHLDIVSCWKNLSSSQTTELTMWEGLFKECLASQIKQHLQHSFAKRLKEYPGKYSFLLTA